MTTSTSVLYKLQSKFEDLPLQALLETYKFLQVSEYASLCQVSTAFARLTQEESAELWLHYCRSAGFVVDVHSLPKSWSGGDPYRRGKGHSGTSDRGGRPGNMHGKKSKLSAGAPSSSLHEEFWDCADHLRGAWGSTGGFGVEGAVDWKFVYQLNRESMRPAVQLRLVDKDIRCPLPTPNTLDDLLLRVRNCILGPVSRASRLLPVDELSSDTDSDRWRRLLPLSLERDQKGTVQHQGDRRTGGLSGSASSSGSSAALPGRSKPTPQACVVRYFLPLRLRKLQVGGRPGSLLTSPATPEQPLLLELASLGSLSGVSGFPFREASGGVRGGSTGGDSLGPARRSQTRVALLPSVLVLNSNVAPLSPATRAAWRCASSSSSSSSSSSTQGGVVSASCWESLGLPELVLHRGACSCGALSVLQARPGGLGSGSATLGGGTRGRIVSPPHSPLVQATHDGRAPWHAWGIWWSPPSPMQGQQPPQATQVGVAGPVPPISLGERERERGGGPSSEELAQAAAEVFLRNLGGGQNRRSGMEGGAGGAVPSSSSFSSGGVSGAKRWTSSDKDKGESGDGITASLCIPERTTEFVPQQQQQQQPLGQPVVLISWALPPFSTVINVPLTGSQTYAAAQNPGGLVNNFTQQQQPQAQQSPPPFELCAPVRACACESVVSSVCEALACPSVASRGVPPPRGGGGPSVSSHFGPPPCPSPSGGGALSHSGVGSGGESVRLRGAVPPGSSLTPALGAGGVGGRAPSSAQAGRSRSASLEIPSSSSVPPPPPPP
eukprot:Cvel_32570.t1-p1 / transcript=Cvel_32570.t1 / gene=Cvel_32570 / organism=Chromera_velia_CCMP2878 / gene_product=hypothetical protein / transcript_product=hypothetical protein / location=Cvel_scaffold5099:1-3336(-) / protein_length=778 / sequence_SO=supercontig / SO=protein_coding / is_pseudo=false